MGAWIVKSRYRGSKDVSCQFFDHSLAGLSWDRNERGDAGINCSLLHFSEVDLRHRLREVWPGKAQGTYTKWFNDLWEFAYDIMERDLVVTKPQYGQMRLGRCARAYYFNDNSPIQGTFEGWPYVFSHLIKVDWHCDIPARLGIPYQSRDGRAVKDISEYAEALERLF